MVHQYKLNGYNIVIDEGSGSVHSVDEVAYDMIEMYPNYSKEDIINRMLEKYSKSEGVNRQELDECYEDITQLKNDGKLFADSSYAQQAVDFKNRNNVIKALCLHVAHTCNLNCSYCFASQGKYQGERALMSFEVGKQAIDFLVANSGTRHNLEVDFFGGEPLMNWNVVKEIVKYARSIEEKCNKHFRFTLTTNGVLVDDEVIEFANKEMHNVVLSLDGRKEIHDHLRVDYAGKGSYETIVPKFRRFVEKRGNRGYYMRGTYTHNNVDFTNDIFHMADMGFTELSMEPVVCSPDDPYALTQEDLPKIFEQYEILAKEMLKREKEGRPFTFYHYMIDLEHGPCIYKRVAGCGSGTEYMAVTPWGELFPCHQFVGDLKYSLGDVWNGVKNTEVQDKFRKCNVFARRECDNCWARLYCSGGCAANSYHATGDIIGIYEYGCELFRKRIECAIMLKVAQAEEGVSSCLQTECDSDCTGNCNN
ncbi:MAG: thioether cross-link-forming SCIFF peptide maturase [Acutalibacteraceae bacterium]|nr:thioether cross-link-forming SCIFF peptide maturase [Acutalibacteraceae bacterium]